MPMWNLELPDTMVNLPRSVLHPLKPWKKCPTRAFCWTCLPRARALKLFPTSPRATSMSSNDGWREDRTQINLYQARKKMKPLYNISVYLLVKLTRQTSLEPHPTPQPTHHLHTTSIFRAFFSPYCHGLGLDHPSGGPWSIRGQDRKLGETWICHIMRHVLRERGW